MSEDRNDQVRVLLTGSRTWNDKTTIHQTLKEYRQRFGDRLVIVHGAATRGADAIAAEWCDSHGVEQEPHRADWRPNGVYDRTAGVRRNTAMVDSQPAEVLAFITNSSRGATQCATYAETSGLPTRRITPSAPQREQARTERDQKIPALQDEITEKVSELTTSEGWLAMLKTASKFHQYSLRNQLLIAEEAAKRGMIPTKVAGYRTWQNLGRQVRKGERGLPVLAPVRKRRDPTDDDRGATDAAPHDAAEVDGGWYVAGFKIEHVWDISQTDGDPLPDTEPKPLTGDGPSAVRRQLEDQIWAAGYTIHYDTPMSSADGVTNPTTKTVTIRPDGSDLHQISTLVHELAHIRMHTGSRDDGLDPGRDEGPVHRGRQEVEAESVTYVVLGALGHDTSDYTIPYVTGWANGDSDKIRATAEAVTTHARQILDQLESQPNEPATADGRDSREYKPSRQAADPRRDDSRDVTETTREANAAASTERPVTNPNVAEPATEVNGTVPPGTAEKITKSATRGPNTPQTECDEERRAYIEAGIRGLYASELATGDIEPNHAVLAQLGQLRGGGYLHPSTVYAIAAHEHAPEHKGDSVSDAIRRGRRAVDQLTQRRDDAPTPRPGGRTTEPARDLGSEPTIDG